MLKMILSRSVFLAAGFKVEKFSPKDYKTMCSLINQKFPIYNEAIQLNKDVRLVDERGKLIGQYSASEARKKAITMKKDILLVNPAASPAICKLESFRQSVLSKFYEEVVNKRNEQLLRKASSSKQLKISTSLSENELKIKAKQVIELAKKNFNVRVYSICKGEHRDQGLGTFENLKSLVQNRCFVEEDIKVQQFEDKDEENFQKNKKEELKSSISIIFRSKDNQFDGMLTEISEKDPESALQIFLKRYYRQEDVEMRDLKATSQQIQDQFDQLMKVSKDTPTQSQGKQTKSKAKKQGNTEIRQTWFTKQQQKQRQQVFLQQTYVERQAKARILNERLKRILQIN